MSRELQENDDERLVHPGGCFLNDEMVHCALNQFHCDGLAYKSRRELADNTDPAFQDHVRRCFGTHPDHVGMCTSPIDNYHCTSDPSNCAIGSKYVQNVPYCTLQHNHFHDRDSPVTLYGLCSPTDDANAAGRLAQDTCVWSIDSCPIPANTFYPASFNTANVFQSLEDACTCEKVRTGACRTNDNRWTCAVSADGCDKDSSYVGWIELESTYQRTCHLCEPFELESDIREGWGGGGGRRGGGGACLVTRRNAWVSGGVGAGVFLAAMVTLVIGICSFRRHHSRFNLQQQRRTTTDSNNVVMPSMKDVDDSDGDDEFVTRTLELEETPIPTLPPVS